MRERAHVAGALHIVLAAQRIDADAVAADIAGQPWRDWPCAMTMVEPWLCSVTPRP